MKNSGGLVLLRGFYLALLPLAIVPRALGLPLVRFAARLVWHLAPSLRRMVRTNRELFDGVELSDREADAYTRAVFVAYGRYVLDLFLSFRRAGPEVEVRGEAHLRSLQAAGSGAVLVTAHTGNWECGLFALPSERPDVEVITAAGRFRMLERLRTSLRRRFGMRERLGGESLDAIGLLDRIRRGGWLAVQGDRAEENRGEWTSFGAAEAYLPVGPWRMARAAQVPILPVTTFYESDRKLIIHIDALIATDVEELEVRRRLHEALAAAVRRAPEQWLMMTPVMRSGPKEIPACDPLSGSSTATT